MLLSVPAALVKASVSVDMFSVVLQQALNVDVDFDFTLGNDKLERIGAESYRFKSSL